MERAHRRASEHDSRQTRARVRSHHDEVGTDIDRERADCVGRYSVHHVELGPSVETPRDLLQGGARDPPCFERGLGQRSSLRRRPQRGRGHHVEEVKPALRDSRELGCVGQRHRRILREVVRYQDRAIAEEPVRVLLERLR